MGRYILCGFEIKLSPFRTTHRIGDEHFVHAAAQVVHHLCFRTVAPKVGVGHSSSADLNLNITGVHAVAAGMLKVITNSQSRGFAYFDNTGYDASIAVGYSICVQACSQSFQTFSALTRTPQHVIRSQASIDIKLDGAVRSSGAKRRFRSKAYHRCGSTGNLNILVVYAGGGFVGHTK